jgi:cysteine desulfurase
MIALGVPKNEATALVRFSLGRESTLEEVEYVANVLPKVVRRVQQFQKAPNER